MARGNLKGTTKGLLGPLSLAWFLSFAGLALAIGGLAALTSTCHATGATNPNILLASANGIIPYNNCANLYEFQWFHLALQAFVVAGLFVTLVMGMRKFRFGVMALLTIATVFMILDTNIFLGYERETRGTGGNFHTRSIVTFIGFLVSAVGNMLAIMLLGAQESTLHPYSSNRAVYGEHDIDPVTGAPMGAGTTTAGTGTGGGFFGRKRGAEPVVTNV